MLTWRSIPLLICYPSRGICTFRGDSFRLMDEAHLESCVCTRGWRDGCEDTGPVSFRKHLVDEVCCQSCGQCEWT